MGPNCFLSEPTKIFLSKMNFQKFSWNSPLSNVLAFFFFFSFFFPFNFFFLLLNVMNTVLEPVFVCLLEWNISILANFEYYFGNHFRITAIYILLLLLCKIMNLI